jgi:Txe/YoeB family toxin of Txe-Axe toxin-antitoxin module
MAIEYCPAADAPHADDSPMFHWGIRLQPTVTQETHDLYLYMKSDSIPSDACLYQVGVYQWCDEQWSVVQRLENLEWETGNDESHNYAMFSGVTMQCNLFLGFTRIDFDADVSPERHSIRFYRLETVRTNVVVAAAAPSSHVSSSSLSPNLMTFSLKTTDDAREPISVIPRETLTQCAWWGEATADTHVMLHTCIQGTCARDVSSLSLVFRIAGKETFPSVHAVLCEPTDGDVQSFAMSATPIFANVTSIQKISIYITPVWYTEQPRRECRICITKLECTPTLLPSATAAAMAATMPPAHISDVDTAAVSHLQRQMETLTTVTTTLQKQSGPSGPPGKRGAKGDRGEAMRFVDLNEAQKRDLRGMRGATGLRGEALVYAELTYEQKQELRGETGDKGGTGAQGDVGQRGTQGESFRFTDFSIEQLESLRGATGPMGERGTCLTFEQLTRDERECLLGEIGPKGGQGDRGERGEIGRIGMTGPGGPEGKIGPRGLPGMPGAKGDAGRRGTAGIDGKHGACARICSTFASEELLLDFIQKSRHIEANSYFIIENNESEDHGTLFMYSGKCAMDIIVACTYIDNLQSIFASHNAVIRAKVLHDEDEWRVSIEIDGRNDKGSDAGVHQLFSSLQNSIKQSGYSIVQVETTEEACVRIGKLCGQRGYAGQAGPPGEAGKSLLGLRLDYLGDEIARLKLKPENRTLFLQLHASKSSEPGFYLYDSNANRWALLHGVNVEDEFMQWMTSFVEDPHHDSIPIAMSMFSTAQKRMDTQYNSLIADLTEYKATNDKWKTFQYENWKAVGSSQYQKLSSQLDDTLHKQEQTAFQVSQVSDRCVVKEELTQLRKAYDVQYNNIEAGLRDVKDKISLTSDTQVLEKHTFESEQNKTHTKFRDIDQSIIKLLKVIAFMKNTPWIKPIRLIQQDIDKMAVEQDSKRERFEKDVVERMDALGIEGREASEDITLCQSKQAQLVEQWTVSTEELNRIASKQKKSIQKLDTLIDKDVPETIVRCREDVERLRTGVQEQFETLQHQHAETLADGLRACNQYTDQFSATLKLQHADLVANTTRITSNETTQQQRLQDVAVRIEKQNETHVASITDARTNTNEVKQELSKLCAQFAEQQQAITEWSPRVDSLLQSHRQEVVESITSANTDTTTKYDKLKGELAQQYDRVIEIMPRTEKLIHVQTVDVAERFTRLSNETTSRTEKVRKELLTSQTKEHYAIRQEMLDADNEVKQSMCQQGQDLKTLQRTFEKQMQDVEFHATTMCKKNVSQCTAHANELFTELRTKCDTNENRHIMNEKKHNDLTVEYSTFVDRTKSNLATQDDDFSMKLSQTAAKMTQDIDRKLLKTADLMQSEWVAQEKNVAEQFTDINTFAAEIKSDLHTTDDKWATQFEAQHTKAAGETAHLLERLRIELTQLLKTSDSKNEERENEAKKQLQLQTEQQNYENKQLGQRLTDAESKLASNIDNRITTTVTNMDSKLREFDQRYANTVQGITSDVQNIDNKCSTVEYLLKARLTSIEEHVQQLFSDGQQLCETTVSKNKTEMIHTFENMRNDVLQSQKKMIQNTAHQIAKSDGLSGERHTKNREDIATMHTKLQEMTKRAVEYETRLVGKHTTTKDSVEELRKEYRGTTEMHRELINRNKQTHAARLADNMRETKSEFERLVNERSVSHDGKLKTVEMSWLTQLHQVNTRVDDLARTTASKMDTILGSITELATHQNDYRRVHDERMRTIIGLTQTMFAELTVDSHN